jgi:hypothetical protein
VNVEQVLRPALVRNATDTIGESLKPSARLVLNMMKKIRGDL